MVGSGVAGVDGGETVALAVDGLSVGVPPLEVAVEALLLALKLLDADTAAEGCGHFDGLHAQDSSRELSVTRDASVPVYCAAPR